MKRYKATCTTKHAKRKQGELRRSKTYPEYQLGLWRVSYNTVKIIPASSLLVVLWSSWNPRLLLKGNVSPLT